MCCDTHDLVIENTKCRPTESDLAEGEGYLIRFTRGVSRGRLVKHYDRVRVKKTNHR